MEPFLILIDTKLHSGLFSHVMSAVNCIKYFPCHRWATSQTHDNY